MTDKKYELTDHTMNFNGITLYQIRSCIDMDGEVERFDLGGWVESEKNLSQEGKCWINNNAKVYGNARVSENARIFEDAEVCGNADVSGWADVYGDSIISGNVKVSGKADINGQIISGDRVITTDDSSIEP